MIFFFHNEKKIKTWECIGFISQPVVLEEVKKEEEEEETNTKRKGPNKAAKNLQIGTVMMSENDKRYYIVKEVGNESKKYKRWILAKGTEIPNEKPIIEKTIENKEEGISVKKSEDSKEKENSVKKSEEKSEDSKEKEKGKRKAPEESASKYDVGYEMKSDNDGKMYVVKSVGKEGKEFKRWVLKK